MDLSSAEPLPSAFYARPVLIVAKACLGQILVHRTAEGVVAGRIVETEAYRGPDDLAAHSAGGRRTTRTEVMYGPPGRAYVFRLYGMHWAFNIVTTAIDHPHAVLIRAVEPVVGEELMVARRGATKPSVQLTNGPGKLCQAFAITGAQYGADLTGGALYLVAGERRAPIGRSPRINIDYAGAWIDKPWRFYERGSRWVSVPPRD